MTAKSPNIVDQLVGAKVRERRMIIGMSQERLAEQLGITFQQVQKYEKGTNRISAGRLQQVASTLGVTISFFFDKTNVDQASALPEKPISRTAFKLVVAFERIESEPIRQSVLALTRALSDRPEEDASVSFDGPA